MTRIEKIRNKFIEVFGNDENVRIVRAPGRVNLIGEHTDYNAGFVLPIALEQDMIIMAQKREDREVIFYSLDFTQAVRFSLDRIKFNSQNRWINYPQGVTYSLQEEGYQLRGMNVLLQSEIPLEAGLSSSAAFEIATALAFQFLNDLEIEPLKIIKLCQRAENEFVGVNCGIMDQFASRLAKKDSALFLDCRSLEYDFVPLEEKIVVCNTKVKRSLANSEYNKRRRECEEGVKILQKYLPEVRALRDVSREDYEKYRDKLPLKIRKRCTHIIYENERVLESVEALKKGDLEKFGKLMNESHQSLKDLYEISCPELDTIVKIAQSLKGVLGARMTGAGFGGCTVNLVKEEAIEKFKERVEEEYFQKTNLHPEIYISSPAEGAEEINL
jgi:galactokinase